MWRIFPLLVVSISKRSVRDINSSSVMPKTPNGTYLIIVGTFATEVVFLAPDRHHTDESARPKEGRIHYLPLLTKGVREIFSTDYCKNGQFEGKLDESDLGRVSCFGTRNPS